MAELSGLVVIGVALPLAVATHGGSLHWIGTYGGTLAPYA